MLCKNNSKSNQTRIFSESCFELEQPLFHAKSLPSWNTTNVTYYLNYINARKCFAIFVHVLRHPLPISRLFTLECFFSYLAFRKGFTFFLFLSTMSKKEESSMSEYLKFTTSIYRILKSQKTIFIDKTVQFSRSFVLWKNIMKHYRLNL